MTSSPTPRHPPCPLHCHTFAYARMALFPFPFLLLKSTHPSRPRSNHPSLRRQTCLESPCSASCSLRHLYPPSAPMDTVKFRLRFVSYWGPAPDSSFLVSEGPDKEELPNICLTVVCPNHGSLTRCVTQTVPSLGWGPEDNRQLPGPRAPSPSSRAAPWHLLRHGQSCPLAQQHTWDMELLCP